MRFRRLFSSSLSKAPKGQFRLLWAAYRMLDLKVFPQRAHTILECCGLPPWLNGSPYRACLRIARRGNNDEG